MGGQLLDGYGACDLPQLKNRIALRYLVFAVRDAQGEIVSSYALVMKALLLASHETDTSVLRDALARQRMHVDLITPGDLNAATAASYALILAYPAKEGVDLRAIAEACYRLGNDPDRVAFILAITHDSEQLNVLVEAGADDYLYWPADTTRIHHTIEICKSRIQKRQRDVIRSQRLLDAVRDAERGEQRFRHLAESSTEILTRASPGGIRLYVSPACRQLLGFVQDELLGSSVFDRVHAADAPALRRALDELQQGADVARAMVRTQRKDGAFIWTDTTCKTIRDPKTKAIEEIITVTRDVTAFVHHEHDKLEAEGQFELFASRAPIGILKVDAAGDCVFINPRACELLGATPSQIAGKGWMTLLNVRDMTTVVESTMRQGVDEKTYSWQMAIRRESGERVWLAVRTVPMRGRDGQVTGYLGTLIDATREQRARQELQASEERFRSIVERITELVCRYLPDGTVTYVNEAYCRAFGKTAETIVGRNFWALVPADDRPVIHQKIASLSPTNPVGMTEHSVVLPSGEIRWHQWYDRGTFDDDGRLVELVATARDVTERRSFEKELAEAGDFLRAVIDAVPDPISVEGDDGNYVMVNRSFAELVGHAREEIVGKPVMNIRPEGRGMGVGRWPKESDEHEISWPTHDGHILSLSEKRAVLTHRKGHRVLVSVMRDITERKRYEAQLALTERLASLGTLAAGIAHEINNPLSYVIGNVSFAMDSVYVPSQSANAPPQLVEVRNALTEALEGAQRIASIVRDVKVFSRADRETLRLVDLERVVDTSLRMVNSHVDGRACVVRRYEQVPKILGNEARLAQVIVNLIMNAAQALPARPASQNQIDIVIRAEHRFVITEVRDNGNGISTENLRHIFDPFFTTKAVGEGMGIGLSICNSIISAHGGRIDVDSTVGIGTVFRISLPAAAEPKNVKKAAIP